MPKQAGSETSNRKTSGKQQQQNPNLNYPSFFIGNLQSSFVPFGKKRLIKSFGLLMILVLFSQPCPENLPTRPLIRPESCRWRTLGYPFLCAFSNSVFVQQFSLRSLQLGKKTHCRGVGMWLTSIFVKALIHFLCEHCDTSFAHPRPKLQCHQNKEKNRFYCLWKRLRLRVANDNRNIFLASFVQLKVFMRLAAEIMAESVRALLSLWVSLKWQWCSLVDYTKDDRLVRRHYWCDPCA